MFTDSHITMGTDELQSGNQSEQKLRPSEAKTELLDGTSQHPQGKGVYCMAQYLQLHCCDMYGYLPHMLMYMYIYTTDTNSHDSEVVLQPRDSHSITSDDEDNDSQGANLRLYMLLHNPIYSESVATSQGTPKGRLN